MSTATATTTARASRRYTPPRRTATSGYTPPRRTATSGSTAARARRNVETVRAPAGRRTVAAVVDGVAVLAIVLGGAELGWRTGALRVLGVSAAGWVDWSWSFHRVAWTLAVVAVVYHGLCTALWQRTPGKLLAGLRVEADGGGRLPPARALWRAAWSATTFIPSLITPLLVTGAWLASVMGGRRSLADRAAGSRVVRARAAAGP